jgi:hypothetical protein
MRERPELAAPIAELGLDGAVDLALGGPEHGPPFLGYLRLATENGVTITRAGAGSGGGPRLTGIGVWILWLVNLAIVCGVAASIAVAQAREPYCDACAEWYGASAVVAVGDGDANRVRELRELLKAGRLTEAVRAIGAPTSTSSAVIALRGCARCDGHRPLLELRQVLNRGTAQAKDVVWHRGYIAASEAREMLDAAAPRA